MEKILSYEQQAKAWLASWNPSFVGKAIVDKNFHFLEVNEQFCDLLGVTPAQILGRKFTDITPEPAKSLDMLNAKLVVEGKSPGYLMDKTYRFEDGNGQIRTIPVKLLAVGVYTETGDFDFFVSRIILDAEMTTLKHTSQSQEGLPLLEKFRQNWHILTTFVGVASWVIYEVVKKLNSQGGYFQ